MKMTISQPEHPTILPIRLTQDDLRQALKTSRVQRLIALLAFVLIVAAVYWYNLRSQYVSQHRAAWRWINAENSEHFSTETSSHGRFARVTLLETLDSKYLPRTRKANPQRSGKKRRLIFVGDIHGCLEELQALLAKARYNPTKDHIIALGDMINKGSDSKGVLNFLIDQGASAVRGNHEDHILSIVEELQNSAVTEQPPASDTNDAFTSAKVKKKSDSEVNLARSLTKKQLAWLNALPLILRIGDVPHMGEIVAVHGGLIPGLALEKQDPITIMNMRIIDPATRRASQQHFLPGSVPWAEFWNKYQRLLPVHSALSGRRRAKHTTVVYGHDAKQGLQIRKYTKGLDSGCQRGDKLTAWIVSDFARDELVQVKCKQR